MARTTRSQLSRLAHISAELEQRQAHVAELVQLLDSVKRGGIIVKGEAWMVDQLGELLEQARQARESLVRAQTAKEVDGYLRELDDLLADPRWEVAQEMRDGLKGQDDDLRKRLSGWDDTLAEWQTRLADLERQLAQAKQARAPVIREERRFRRLQEIWGQADRARRDQDLGRLAASVDQLGAEAPEAQGLGSQIGTKIEEVRPCVRHADLLFLRATPIERRYRYTVLLRTASEPGSHGINIQDVSPLAEQDRSRMFNTIDQITKALNAGLAKAFARTASAPAAAPEAAAAGPVPAATPEATAAGPAPAAAPEVVAAPGALRPLNPVDEAGAIIEPLDVNKLAQDVGGLMYELLVPEAMQRYLRETACSVTINTDDLELPWELMWHDGEFLCLERPVARMPMGQAFPRVARPPARLTGKLSFLLVYADPDGNLQYAAKEVDEISEELKKEWGDLVQIDVLKGPAAEGGELNTRLRSGKYDVIHYTGHGAFIRAEPGEPDYSGLLLHDREVFFGEKARRLLEGRPLVFLNACESGRSANEKQARVADYLQHPASGLASSFLYGGALGCIGALWPIYDQPSAEFAVEFYNRVLEGMMIGEAMRQARLKIRADHPNEITWAAFVLYGDPTYRLVE